MADGVALPASGVTAASDEIAGEHHQRIKIEAAYPTMDDPSAMDGTVTDLLAQPSVMYEVPLLQVQARVQGFNRYLLRSVVGTGVPSAHTYADGESIGGAVSLMNDAWNDASSLLVANLMVSDREGIGPDLDVLLGGNLTSMADATPWEPAFHPDLHCRIPVRSADWVAYGAGLKVAVLTPNVRIPHVGGNFDAGFIARGAYALTDPANILVQAFLIYD